MSEPADGVPLRRPDSARPRGRRDELAEPPSPAELVAIERQLTELARVAGATVSERPEIGALLTAFAGHGPGLNFASSIRWPAAGFGQRLARLEELMRRDGEWPALVVADGLTEPSDIEQRLAAAGWVRLEDERIMWTRRPPHVPHLDPALRVEAVTPHSVDQLQAQEQEVFGLAPERSADRLAQLIGAVESGELRGFVVRLHGATVATARLTAGDGVAALSAIGVATAHRRRGYGALVTAIAARAGLAMGNRLVFLSVDEANEPAVSLYRGLGFAPSFSWSQWVAPA
jgi:ribosomal protein S18 acetylase RimI-like enzyme